MKTEHRICNHTTHIQKIYDFYQNERGLEIYKDWDRSEDDKGVIFSLGDILVEYIFYKNAQKPMWVYLCIEDKDVEVFYSKCTIKNKTELIHTPWNHIQFSVFDPEWFEIKFFKDNSKE